MADLNQLDPPGYLQTRPLARDQYRTNRRGHRGTGRTVTGCIVVHTAESVMDTVGPDTGAENVASWMTRRDTPGSYHDLADSDSTIHLVSYRSEAYQDGTGSNPWALSLSFALGYLDWARMSEARRAAFIEQGAQAAARQARFVYATEGIRIPARRISRADSERGLPGFISHAERDPARRKDPGNAAGQFPWARFLARFEELTRDLTTDPNEETPMDRRDLLLIADVVNTVIDRKLNPDGKGNLLVRIRDEVARQGPRTVETTKAVRQLLKLAALAEGDHARFAEAIADLEGQLEELEALADVDPGELVEALTAAVEVSREDVLAAVEAEVIAADPPEVGEDGADG